MIGTAEIADVLDASKHEFAELAVEVQTDKERVKALPCVGCNRPLIVSTFYAPASAARCAECKGDQETGVINAPVPGKSDPGRVSDLRSVLVNPSFGHAVCPVHPDDEEHEMELKVVNHSEYHGPSELVGYKNGVPEFRQLDRGESVMHQCLKCRATVSYSTMAQVQFARVNEPRSTDGLGVNTWIGLLDVREERKGKS